MNFDFRPSPFKLKTAIIAVLLGFAFGAVMILLAGHSPVEIYAALIKGAVGSQFAFASSMRWATPLLFMGVAAAIAFRGGIFNMGIEGQLYAGAMAATIIGVTFTELPGYILLPLMLLASIVAGMLWAAPPILAKLYFGSNEVVPCMMLNYIAVYLTNFLVSQFFLASGARGATIKTDKIAAQAQLSKLIPGSSFTTGFLIGLAVLLVYWVIVKKTRFGYELGMSGLNPKFAQYGGINVNRTRLKIMLFSGGIAGLGGAIEIMGVRMCFESAFSPNFGTDGVLSALLGNCTPLGTFAGALFMGFLKAGALSVERMTSVSRALAVVIQSMIICFVSARYLGNFLHIKWPWKKHPPKEGVEI